MTSISSSSTNLQATARLQMNQRLEAAESLGQISSTDETALSTALDNIDSSISSGTDSSSGSGTSMKDKMDNLVNQQVSNGTLTDDQAAELKKMFAQGHHGGHHHHGAPPATDSSDPTQSTDSDPLAALLGTSQTQASDGSSDTSASDSDTSSATDKIDALISFLQNLRSSFQTAYGSDPSSNNASSSAAGLVVNSLA